jgi:hypothetical protein
VEIPGDQIDDAAARAVSRVEPRGGEVDDADLTVLLHPEQLARNAPVVVDAEGIRRGRLAPCAAHSKVARYGLWNVFTSRKADSCGSTTTALWLAKVSTSTRRSEEFVARKRYELLP